MESRAQLKYYRSSPRKVRLVADMIRGKPVQDAINALRFTRKSASLPLRKLIESAVANAEQKNENQQAGIEIDDLVVSTICVDEGPSMWRIRPRAQGRASWVQKRASHITVVLAER